MKNPTRTLLSIALLLSSSASARADVWWTWSFGTEQGLFRTDGTLADTAGSHTFEILDFCVTSSGQGVSPGSLSRGRFLEGQPTQGFAWSGTGVTQFYRSNGSLTNGSNFSLPDFANFYGFGPNEGGGAFESSYKRTDLTMVFSSGPVTLAPLADPVEARPDVLVGSRKKPSRQKLDDHYTATGRGQTIGTRLRDGRGSRVYFSVHTDAEIPEPLAIEATGGNRDVDAKYVLVSGGRSRDVTAAVTRGGRNLGAIVPGEFAKVVATFTPRSTRKAKRTFRFACVSGVDAAKTDVARVKVKGR